MTSGHCISSPLITSQNFVDFFIKSKTKGERKKRERCSSWLDHGDGHLVDGLRLGRVSLHRQRELGAGSHRLQPREQRRAPASASGRR
jgi:hypothetical protein